MSIPPRQDAVWSPTATTAPRQRDEHLLAIESAGRCGWKWTSGYDAQRHAENVFARCKRLFGDWLRVKRDASQEREAALLLDLCNKTPYFRQL